MSSPASRRRQRQRRRARERVWSTLNNLADREVLLASYERVLADMIQRDLPYGAEAIAVVRGCRDATAREREQLRGDHTRLREAVVELEAR